MRPRGALDRRVPLMRPRWPKVRIPRTQDGPRQRILGPQRVESLLDFRAGNRRIRVDELEFIEKRRIEREAKIRTGAFEKAGNTVSAPKDVRPAPACLSPRKTKPRLEIQLVRVVQAAAVAVHTREQGLACR